MEQRGKLIIFSAPSGSGKSTIIQSLLNRDLNLSFSISATSRAPRGTEKNGIEYYFIKFGIVKVQVTMIFCNNCNIAYYTIFIFYINRIYYLFIRTIFFL